MKKTLFLITLVVLALGMAAAADAGTVSPTVSVTATVQGTCRIITDPGDMAFTIDPGDPGPVVAVVGTDPTVKCTNGLTATLAATSANAGGAAAACPITGTLDDGTNTMDYTFSCAADVTGAGHSAAATAQPLLVGGSIAASQYADKPASAAYGDTVTVDVNF
jgi:spore coat protein U-like protein